jgi:hypothetical protein
MQLCSIEGDDIVIRIAIKNLPIAFAGGVDLGSIPPGYEITDPKKFAEEVVYSLEAEDEQGTTDIHRLFDKAMWDAVENGAEGCEEIENDE